MPKVKSYLLKMKYISIVFMMIYLILSCSTSKPKDDSTQLEKFIAENPRMSNEEIDVYYSRLGAIAFHNKDYALSLVMYYKALEVNPLNADALKFSGTLLMDYFDKPVEASKYYEKLIAFHPSDPEAYWGYSSCLIKMGDLLKEKKYYNKAIEIAKKGIYLSPGSMEIVCNLAVAYLRLEQYDEAVVAFEKCSSRYPSYTKFLNLSKKIAAEKQEGEQ